MDESDVPSFQFVLQVCTHILHYFSLVAAFFYSEAALTRLYCPGGINRNVLDDDVLKETLCRIESR